MSLTEFRAAFPGEGQHIEFKQGLPEEKIQEAVVAFSNSDGGVILIGVGPDGSLHGRRLDGEATARLHRALTRARDPGRYEIFELLVEETPLTVVAVARRREGFSQTANGRVLVRKAAMNEPLMGFDLSDFITRRALARFEITESGAVWQDVDDICRRSVAEAWNWPDDENLIDRLTEKGLVRKRRTEPALTVAGALYLLAEPQRVLGKSYVEIFRYGDSGNAYDKRLEVTGPLPRQVEETTRLVVDELGSDMVIVGLKRVELPRIPVEVLREAVANAVAHRTYENHRSPVRLEIRPDAIKVISPGPLPEPVTVQNLREQNAPRNMTVISTLRRYRLAEDAGRGIDVMQDSMEAHLLDPPHFIDDGSCVTVVLPRTSAVTPEERAWVQEVESKGEIRGSDRVVLVHAMRGAVLTNRSVRDLLQVDSVDARNCLQRLRDAGLLMQSGERGGANYALAPQPAITLRRHAGPAEFTQLVLQLAAEGPVTNRQVREHTGLDRVQVTSLLNRMVQAGNLLRRGERKGIHYIMPS
ncbi:ATP-binding protein [Sphaerimonospora thailandensis]|nr:ATP-binding protein [Sphaerimonospora thailandensis]